MYNNIANKNLKRCFKEMQATLDNHMNVLNAEPLAQDTRKILFENRRAYKNLKTALASAPARFRIHFKPEADRILKKNKCLSRIVDLRKQELSRMLHDSARGKRILKGYRFCGSNTKTYRFMNTTG